MRRQPVGVALLLVAASATAAAQVRVEAGGTLRAEFHISTHLDWNDFRAPPAAPALEMRRARLGVKGAVFGRLEYEIEHDFRERELGWRDVYADVAFGRALQIRGGRFKAPFSLDQLTAAVELDLVARSLAAHYLAPGRDTGVMAHGRLFGRRVRFQAAGFRGSGDNVRADERRDGRRGPLLAGRVVFRPWSESKTSELRRGLALGAAVTTGRVPDGPYSLRGRTAADVPFFPVIAVSGVRRRYGGEVEWRAGPVAAAGELMRAVDERLGQSTDDDTLPALVAHGWYIRGTWLITGERKTARVRPARAFLKGGVGAVELAARVEDLALRSRGAADAPVLSTRAEALPRTGDRVATLGVNWYLNRFLKLQANAVRDWHREEGASGAGASRRWSPALRLQFSL